MSKGEQKFIGEEETSCFRLKEQEIQDTKTPGSEVWSKSAPGVTVEAVAGCETGGRALVGSLEVFNYLL